MGKGAQLVDRSAPAPSRRAGTAKHSDQAGRGILAEAQPAVGTEWSQLDPDSYPFTRSIATRLHEHDDRADFAGGIDLILDGIAARQAGGA